MAAIKAKGPDATTDDDAVVVFTEAEIGGQKPRHLAIVNEGTEPGSFSFDGGSNFRRIPGQSARQLDGIGVQGEIQIKRDAGGPNMTGVFIDIW